MAIYSGFLNSWECIYYWIKTKNNIIKCPICSSQINIEYITPVYNNEENNSNNIIENIPERPKPNFSLIDLNANLLGSSKDFKSNHLFNINNNKRVAGFGLFPCLFIHLFNKFKFNFIIKKKHENHIEVKLNPLLNKIYLLLIALIFLIILLF